MALIDVSEYENVNISSIDSQHLRIIKIINTLHDVMGFEADNTIKVLLKQYSKVLQKSFETEEKYMKQVNVVNYISHKLEHDRYLKKIADYTEKVDSGSAVVDEGFVKSLRNWFINHQEFKDKKIGKVLYSKGIR